MVRKNVFSNTLRSVVSGADEEVRSSSIPPDEDHGDRDAGDATSPAPADKGKTEDSTSDIAPRKRSSPNVEIFKKSFQEQMLRSLQDVDPERIDSSRFQDRLDIAEDLEGLKESIQKNGQQVPVLLRKVAGDRYEVVYGRRRIMACRQLQIDVRAMVVEISDEDALIAQGLENAARLENSYIEKALFVAQISEAGYSSDTIQKALDIDKTQASKMRGVVRDIPRDVIMAIGAAHGAGRRPWEELRKMLSGDDAPGQARLLKMIDLDLPSADRLKKLLTDLRQTSRPKAPSPAPLTHIGNGDFKLDRTPRSLTVKADRNAPEAFLRHLEDSIGQIYEDWRKNNG
ncbi:plasmid partitioning protein RepB [Epibacterium sp. DP7N7-1]|nr:plasmid partitioning protein RepB [Epibacterium sp. DP7N7-1]